MLEKLTNLENMIIKSREERELPVHEVKDMGAVTRRRPFENHHAGNSLLSYRQAQGVPPACSEKRAQNARVPGKAGGFTITPQASFYRDGIFSAMSELRLCVDELETLVAKKHWPLPSYAELLHSVV